MIISPYSLPEGISIDGIFYAVNTDFKIWLEIAEIISSKELNIFEKAEKTLALCYKDSLPQTFNAAINGMFEFYRCAKESTPQGATSIHEKPVIDLVHDRDMIAAAFLHDYNIDLFTMPLHWWKFKALLSSLSEENKIVKVMGYRAINIGDIKDKEQKKFYKKMKSLYSLPDNRSEEEKEIEMLEKLNSIFEEV